MDRMDGDLTSEQMKQVHYIESSARDLQEMVNDLLDLAKVEAGKIRIRPKRFEVQRAVQRAKGMLKPLLADNNSVDLIFDDTTRNLPPLRTDEGKVSQILRNLISNALKFTPRGKVADFGATMDGNQVQFTVRTPESASREHHETIFQEFGQVENPLQERHRGTGLGLPLCRNLAMLLGGKMWLESEAGKGSTFFAQIPAFMWERRSAPSRRRTCRRPNSIALRFFLEDDFETAHLFETFLRNSEFQPILASNVGQAELWTRAASRQSWSRTYTSETTWRGDFCPHAPETARPSPHRNQHFRGIAGGHGRRGRHVPSQAAGARGSSQ